MRFRKATAAVLAALMSLALILPAMGESEQTRIYEDIGPQQGAPQSQVYVQPVQGLADDFVRGMDISSMLSEEESGVVWRDEQGQPRDLLELLAQAGIDTIRVRVWNDPYDAEGNGYGGGNCDAARAAQIGARAAAAGLCTMADFHYSDFWADPTKQMVPKAWAGMNVQQKAEALYRYTRESLALILDAGAQVTLVQLGNEINMGMAGETEESDIIQLLRMGSRAVREISAERGLDIRIAVHFTEVDAPAFVQRKTSWLNRDALDYDVFGVSYYPYWHGSLANLQRALRQIQAATGKQTMVLETAFPFTYADGDCSGNSVSGEGDSLGNYYVSVQGQVQAVRDVFAAASEAGSCGVFYWEGAWIPVGSDWAKNQQLWERYGSGWASSYAAAYDPYDAGVYYGGSSWDNQAMFAFDGTALPSLQMFRCLTTGTVSGQTVQYAQDPRASNVVAVAGNQIRNPGFEEEDLSMWEVSYTGDHDPTDRQTKSADAKTGDNAFHFWSSGAVEFRVEQRVQLPAAGTWKASAWLQGGDVGSDPEIYMYVIANGEVYHSEPVMLDGWVKWKQPTIMLTVDQPSEVVVGFSVKCAPRGWGTIDDVELVPAE